MTDRHDTAFDVLVGFRSSLGNLRLRLYDFVAGANGPPVSVETPDLLNFAEEDDLNEPVYLSAQLGGPPFVFPSINRKHSSVKQTKRDSAYWYGAISSHHVYSMAPRTQVYRISFLQAPPYPTQTRGRRSVATGRWRRREIVDNTISGQQIRSTLKMAMWSRGHR